ncbi:LANO_0F05842g1_1 [Lachancea nothofagi CBS 11611]|uniref:LANO_0F05842g1_1 n=1 Tax=Lachancea nothofagi CBS 11611 TaxID=1266666 RepID=A0A1G4K895_9SACH|nr:LANO_0F05842g1_1 [Lachancea nothofagi CBS 11611]
MQEIYVPTGDDQCIRLTLVSIFQEIAQVQKYLGSIQETFSVELESCETITQNLKIRCVSHGSCRSCPLYILEFDQVSKNYALWKSAGKWALGTILACLFATRPGPKSKIKLNVAKLQTYLDSTKVSEKHDSEFLTQTLQKLNVDWHCVPFDFQVFLDLLDESIDREIRGKTGHNYLELVSPLQYKSLITMAVLRAKVTSSKQKLQNELQEYDSHMAKSQEGSEELHSSVDIKNQQLGSSDNSKFSETPQHSPSPIEDDYSLSSRQIMTNFQKHFKGLAETFETFDIEKCSPRGTRNWKVVKPPKSSKSDSKKVKA